MILYRIFPKNFLYSIRNSEEIYQKIFYTIFFKFFFTNLEFEVNLFGLEHVIQGSGDYKVCADRGMWGGNGGVGS